MLKQTMAILFLGCAFSNPSFAFLGNSHLKQMVKKTSLTKVSHAQVQI